MELFGGEEFALGGVGGLGEGGHEGLVEVDFAGEELSSLTLLRLGKTQASLVLRSTFAMFSCVLLILFSAYAIETLLEFLHSRGRRP